MKTFRFEPKWRDSKESIEVVTAPTREWFHRVTVFRKEDGARLVRFTLLGDGELFFGDGYTVMHHDILRFRGPHEIEPIMAGSFLQLEGGPWRIGVMQYFLTSATRAHAKAGARLLGRLACWPAVAEALGCDPLTLPTWEETNGIHVE